MTNPTVIIRHCPDYDVDRIERIVGEGLDALNLKPFGRTLVKPNCVASGEHFPNAHTRPEFLEGVFKALKSRAGSDVKEIALGERCGITIPTRFAFKEAKYYEMLDRVGELDCYHFDEVPQVEIPLYHDGRLRDFFYTPEPVAKADFFVNCPKFKAHPWTTVTFAMKNYIGIQDDRHRLIDHDHRLNRKVADLQYITQPQFMAIDAIVAGEGRMLTPIPFDMQLVIMGNNQVAFDAVCCHIIGLDPMEVEHIRLAYERGFGPNPNVRNRGHRRRPARGRIRALQVVPDRAHPRRRLLRRYQHPSLLRSPPWRRRGVLLGRLPRPRWKKPSRSCASTTKPSDDKMPPVHLVFGDYKGTIDAQEGEKVVFIGDCAQYHGQIAGKPVDIESTYIDRSTWDPKDAKYQDIYAKMVGVELLNFKARNTEVMRLKGCPVSVAEQVLLLVKLGKLKNPYLDPSQAMSFTHSYLSWRARQLINKVFFRRPYNIAGETERGAARPVQNLPPTAAE